MGAAFEVVAVVGLMVVGRTGGGVLGGEARASKGDVYIDIGRLGVGAFTGGSGAGAVGGLPIAPFLIHGQRSASVRFDGSRLGSSVLLVVTLGLSSSLELEIDLSAPATVPSGSLTLYPKIESPSTEY